jgi:lysozyme
VSHYQGEVDWLSVAASGVSFAFIKATDGLDDIDPRFAQNWTGAKAAGSSGVPITFSAHAWMRNNQAGRFLRVVAMDNLALPPALYVEVTDGLAPLALQTGIRTWLEIVQTAFGCTPIVYTDASFWQKNCAGDFRASPLRLACYAAEPEVPATWQAWTFWQHTDAGNVNGISGQVDLNYCALSYENLRKLGAH